MAPLVQSQISRIRKPEWLMAFAEARKDAFTLENVLNGWRGAGLLPFSPEEVL
jgi:hypothetical protein